MPEIIGSAYVRIKAITDGLGKDIQSGLDKGASDVDMTPAGKKVGADFGGGIGDGVDESKPKINKKIGSIGDDADDSGGFKFGRKWAAKLYTGMEQESDKKQKPFLTSLSKKMDKFGDSLKVPRIALLGLFGSPAIGGAVRTLGGYATTLASQIGFIGQAAIGAAGAVGGAFGLAALAAGPLLLAFKAQTPALDLFQAKAKVFGEIWKDVGVATQTFLLPALTDVMRQSLSLVPMFSDFGKAIGFVAGETAKMGINMLTSTEMISPLHTILDGSIQVFGRFGGAAVSLGRAFIEIFAALTPVAIRFADTLKSMADRFAWTTTVKARSGELTKVFELWYDRAEQIGRSLSNLLKALLNVFQIGGDAATPFFDTFEAFSQKWLDFTRSTEGQDRIKKVFEDAIPVAQSINALLKDIIGWIATPALTGRTDGIIRFFDMMRTIVLPALKDISGQLTGALTSSLESFVTALVGFIKTTASSGSLKIFFQVLSNILEVLSTITQIPGLSQFIGLMLAMGGAFKAFNVIAKPIIGTLGAIQGAFGSFIKKDSFKPVMSALKDFATGKGGFGGVTSALGTFATTGPQLMSIAMAGIGAALIGGIAAFTAWQTNVKRVEAEVRQFNDDILGGADVIDTLSKSYENILKTRDSFDDSLRQTGFTIRDVTQFVNDNIGDMDKFRDAWDDADEGTLGFNTNILKIPPALAQFGDASTHNEAKFRELLKAVDESKAWGTTVPQSVKAMYTELLKLEHAGKLDANAFKEFFDGAVDLDKEAVAASASIREFGLSFLQLKDSANLGDEAVRLLTATTDPSHGLQAQQDAMTKLIALYPALAQAAGAPMETIKKVTEEVNKQFGDLISKLEELRGGQADADAAARDYTIAWDDLIKSWDDGKASMKGTGAEVAKAENELVRFIESGKKSAEATALIDKTGQSSALTLLDLGAKVRKLAGDEGYTKEQTDKLLSSMGILDNQQIQATVTADITDAQKGVDELQKELDEFTGVPESVRIQIQSLLTAGDANSLAAATTELENWKKIHSARGVVIPIKGDTTEAVTKVMGFLGWTMTQEGAISIAGHTVKAEDAIKVATDIANGAVGTITVEGDIDPATKETKQLLLTVDASTGTISVDGNTNPADVKTDKWRFQDLPKKDAPLQIGANTKPADVTVDNYIKDVLMKKHAQLTIDAIVNWQENGIVLGANGQKISLGQAIGGPQGRTQTNAENDNRDRTPFAATTMAATTMAATTSLRSTISRGRASGVPFTGVGLASLAAPEAMAFGPSVMAATTNSSSGSAKDDEAAEVEVPATSGLGSSVPMNIIVKIGERDITDIVDVQMNGRMGQLATAIRRAN